MIMLFFKKYGYSPVIEDYYKINNNVFCVADGVTRDDINGNAVEYPKNEEEVKKWIKYYPNPSGSYKAAKLICNSFVDEISNYDMNIISEKVVEEFIKKSK